MFGQPNTVKEGTSMYEDAAFWACGMAAAITKVAADAAAMLESERILAVIAGTIALRNLGKVLRRRVLFGRRRRGWKDSLLIYACREVDKQERGKYTHMPTFPRFRRPWFPNRIISSQLHSAYEVKYCYFTPGRHLQNEESKESNSCGLHGRDERQAQFQQPKHAWHFLRLVFFFRARYSSQDNL